MIINNLTTAISLVSLKTVESLNDIIESSPHKLHFELSYEMTPQLIEKMRPKLMDSVVSIHAACPNVEFFPNLASHDEVVIAQSFKDLEMSLDTAVSFGANNLVLHPGYSTDKAIPSDNVRRQKLLTSEEFTPYIWNTKGSICDKNYIDSQKYKAFSKQAIKNLEKFAQICQKRGVTLAVENLNPRVGYLFQTPNEMVKLIEKVDCSICLDIGHLWVSSCLYGFNYLEAIRTILATHKVATTHLHSNISKPILEGKEVILEDNHSSLNKYNFPYKEVIKEIAKFKANMVLEVKESPLENHNLLIKELSKLKL